jgi:hypothetical protein
MVFLFHKVIIRQQGTKFWKYNCFILPLYSNMSSSAHFLGNHIKNVFLNTFFWNKSSLRKEKLEILDVTNEATLWC